MKKKGTEAFTLIELLAVLLIVGILGAIAIPKYERAMESSRADEALAIAQTVYTGNRMYRINNPTCGYCTTSALTCPAGGGCAGGSLISRNYVPSSINAGGSSYTYYGANDAAASTYATCARRNGGNAPFNTWSYRINVNGTVSFCTSAPQMPAPAGAVNAGACPICP